MEFVLRVQLDRLGQDPVDAGWQPNTPAALLGTVLRRAAASVERQADKRGLAPGQWNRVWDTRGLDVGKWEVVE